MRYRTLIDCMLYRRARSRRWVHDLPLSALALGPFALRCGRPARRENRRRTKQQPGEENRSNC